MPYDIYVNYLTSMCSTQSGHSQFYMQLYWATFSQKIATFWESLLNCSRLSVKKTCTIVETDWLIHTSGELCNANFMSTWLLCERGNLTLSMMMMTDYFRFSFLFQARQQTRNKEHDDVCLTGIVSLRIHSSWPASNLAWPLHCVDNYCHSNHLFKKVQPFL